MGLISEVDATARAFLEAAGSAQSIEQLDETFIAYVQSYGFTTAVLMHFTDKEGEVLPKIVFGRDPTDWVERYTQQEYGLIDPTLPLACRSRHGFTWNSVETSSRGRVRQLFGEAREIWAEDSFIVPIRGPYGELSVVNLLSDHRLDIDEALAASLQGMCTIYASVGMNMIERGPAKRPDTTRSLAKREVQCLFWMSAGKRDPEIAAILGLGTSTVKQYIDSAKAKLGAVTRAELATKALIMGYLLPHRALLR